MELKTENRLSIMEQKIDNLNEDIREVKNDVKDIAQDIKDHVKWEAEKYEKLDNKYSGKWVEKAIISIATTLIVAAIIGLFTYFTKK